MGFLGGIFDTGAGKAYDMNVANMEFIKKLYGNIGTSNPNKIFGAINQADTQSTSTLKGAVDEVRGGFDRAQSTASNIGSNAYQRVIDRGVQTQAATRSGLAQSGLLNSTGAANLASQTNYQTNQQLGGIDEALMSLRSGLSAQGGQAVGGAMTNLAGNYWNRPQMLGQAAGTLGGQMSQFEFAPGQSLFQQFGGLLPSALGGLKGLGGLFNSGASASPGGGGMSGAMQRLTNGG